MELAGVIERALNRTEGLPNSERARQIVAYIEIAQDLAGVAPAPVAPKKVLPTSDIGRARQTLIVTPDEDEAPPPPRMFGQQRKKDEQVRSVEEIAEHLKRAAPTVIEVDLGDGKQPIKMARSIQIDASSVGTPGDGIVRLVYLVPGQDDGPTVLFSSADEKLDVKGKMEEIQQAAKAVVSRKQRSVQPRMAKSFDFNVDSAVRAGIGGDADDVMDSGSAVSRLAPLSAEAIRYLNGNS